MNKATAYVWRNECISIDFFGLMFISPQDTMPSKQTIVIADTFMSGAE